MCPPAAPHTQPNPTPSLRSALSGPEWPQQANSCVSKRQIKHVCIDAQACGRVAELACVESVLSFTDATNTPCLLQPSLI